MIFSIILLIFVLLIGYFHYAQGLFSATISAILCAIAAVLAIGCHETVAEYFYLKCPEIADGLSIAGIFAVAYVVPRLLFDKLIQGNVRFPLLVDKIGAGVMGVIAGLFATGVFAVAAESLPFGPAIGGYARQDLQDVAKIAVPSVSGAAVDSQITDQMIGDSLTDPVHLRHLWLHQDEMVVGLTRQLSDSGALSWQRPFSSLHPDYITELFGERLGIQLGTKRTAIDSATATPVKVIGAYALPHKPPVIDAEIKVLHSGLELPEVPGDKKLVAIEVTFSLDPDMASDTDQFIRLSCANVRLKSGDTDYNPLGTMVDHSLLLENRIDDPLVIDVKGKAQTVDFLFALPIESLTAVTAVTAGQVHSAPGGKADKEQIFQFPENSFLQIKRYARQDLTDTLIHTTSPSIISTNPADSNIMGGVLRKGLVKNEVLKNLGISTAPHGSAAAPDAHPATPTPAGLSGSAAHPGH